MSFRSRNSTLNHTFINELAKRVKYGPDDFKHANEAQIRILYGGDASRFAAKECVYCGKARSKRNDHFISLIKSGEGKPSMYGEHPLNKVYCCRLCNYETLKARLLADRTNLREYLQYVSTYCPKLPYSEATLCSYFERFRKFTNEIADEIPLIPVRQVPVEDIDAT